jgi:NitT/TauT family transport system substrate-binding protein
MSTLGIPTEGGEDGVEVLRQGFNVDPLLQRQADCISTMTYNEYWQVIDAGIAEDDLITFKYEDQGVATLEDGLYVLEDRLEDPAFVDRWRASCAPRCAAGNGPRRTPRRRR